MALVTPLGSEYCTPLSRYRLYSCLSCGTYGAAFRLIFGFHRVLHQLCLTGFEHLNSSLKECYMARQFLQNENTLKFKSREKVCEKKSKGYTQSTWKGKSPLILNYLIFGAFLRSVPRTVLCSSGYL